MLKWQLTAAKIVLNLIREYLGKGYSLVPRGHVIGRHCGDVSVIAWKDVPLVTTVSTYHNNDMVSGTRAGEPCLKPTAVNDYNKCMGGVDLKEQVLSTYLLERKRGLKWYIKVFRRLLNTSNLKAYTIYCKESSHTGNSDTN